MTDIPTLFEAWTRAYDACGEAETDEQASALCHEFLRIEKHIMAIPARTHQEMVMKIVCETQGGDFVLSSDLALEACRVVGWPQTRPQQAKAA